jgi:orotidine-5'-phosphate decarboxylase
VAAHCRLVIDAVADQCVGVKPQVACFERLGGPGWEALREVIAYARGAGLIVIADAKRGDVDVTAQAYAQAFMGVTDTPFGPVPGLGADALTVNPWLGGDALEPFVKAARQREGGLFVLARNSNPGAADLQDLELAAGGSVSDAAARMIAELGADGVGAAGLSDIGAVVGATAAQRLAGLRAAMPHTIFLLPGVGAQGGRIEDLAPVFAPGPAAGLIPVSRGIVNAHERDGEEPAVAARAQAGRLREAAWRLVSPAR